MPWIGGVSGPGGVSRVSLLVISYRILFIVLLLDQGQESDSPRGDWIGDAHSVQVQHRALIADV